MPLLHVVLYQPDIPQNTGNIGRTCVAVGAKLWLVRPLGFRVDERHLRRAAMDYWRHLDWEVVDSLDELRGKLTAVEGQKSQGRRSKVAGRGPTQPAADDVPPAETTPPKRSGSRFWKLTRTAERLLWEAAFQPGDVLLFGSETRGLPPSVLAEDPASNLKLPMRPEVRSLNLASAVNTVVYEAIRQFGGLPACS